jgi:hypothetical protein
LEARFAGRVFVVGEDLARLARERASERGYRQVMGVAHTPQLELPDVLTRDSSQSTELGLAQAEDEPPEPKRTWHPPRERCSSL